MEMKFNKTVMRYLQSVVRKFQTQEQSQQVRLTDGMPDAEKVVACWGQVILRSKQWETDCIQVTGGVTTHILYMSRESKKLQCMETWVPFQIELEIPDHSADGSVTVRPSLHSVEARVLSERKLQVYVTVGVTLDASVMNEANLYFTNEHDDMVQILSNHYPLQLPVEASEKHFNLEESLDVSSSNDDIKILRYTMEMVLTESKIIADKLVLRGNALVDILYMDADGGIYSWNTEIPVSQYAQLSMEYEPGSHADICFAVTDLDIETTDGSGFVLKAGVLAQYTIYENKNITIIEDAYSNARELEIHSDVLQLPSILEQKEEILEPEVALELADHKILDIALFMEELQTDIDDASFCVKPKGYFQILSLDPEGNLQNSTRKWESVWRLDASPDIATDVSAAIEGRPKIRGQKIAAPLKLKLACMNVNPISIINDIQIGEPLPTNQNRPSIILCRAESKSLWELAKCNGSTVEAIQKANNITSEPIAEKLLLIPVH